MFVSPIPDELSKSTTLRLPRFLSSRVLLFRKSLTFPILAALTPEKHSVEYIEKEPKHIDYDKQYDLVAISSITQYVHLTYEIADEFRRRGATVVIGGWHASALPEEAKQHADSVVVAEAEETWPQLLKDFERGKLKSFYVPIRPVDPKQIPRPRNIYQKQVGFGIQATRGCPYSCDFCATTAMKFRNIFRKRAVDDVIEDIKSVNTKTFFFQDDSLTIYPEYTKQIFRKMKELNKKFVAFGNIDVLSRDKDFLKLAHEAGCIGWMIGFESISQEALESIGKRTNKAKRYKDAIRKIRDHGMVISGNFMFGFDSDTPDIFNKTDDFVNKSEIDMPFYYILTPYPGTPLFDRLEKEGRILTRDWSKYDSRYNVVFEPKHMTPNELLKRTLEIRRNQYNTSRYIIRTIKSMKFGFHQFLDTFAMNSFYKLTGYA